MPEEAISPEPGRRSNQGDGNPEEPSKGNRTGWFVTPEENDVYSGSTGIGVDKLGALDDVETNVRQIIRILG